MLWMFVIVLVVLVVLVVLLVVLLVVVIVVIVFLILVQNDNKFIVLHLKLIQGSCWSVAE